MTTLPETVDPPAPTPGLIASLDARTTLDRTALGAGFAVVIVTHPRPQFDDLDEALVEQQMLGVAKAANAHPCDKPPRSAGTAVYRAGADLVVQLAHCTTGILVRDAQLARILNSLDGVLLIIGLDPLSSVASRAEVNRYIAAGRSTGRLHVTIARPERRAP